MSASKSIELIRLPRRIGEVAWGDLPDRLRRLEQRLARERAAREQAERLLESKSLELFCANQQLLQINGDLEERVDRRTRELERAKRSALELVEQDHLTKIPSRFRFSQCLANSLERIAQNGALVGLLLIDIDDFKLVNDSHGHTHGDHLLQQIAVRLRTIARKHELVARIGGDEFAVILEGDSRQTIKSAAERFSAVFKRPVTVLGITLKISGSMGLAISPEHTSSELDLQRFADLALYRVKAEGGGALAVFENALLDSYEDRQRIESEFRSAVARGCIDLWYQPIVGLADGRIEAVEALARWSDSQFEQISPSLFIPLAEQCGLIREVGRDLLDQVISQAKTWRDDGLIGTVHFNLSPIELLDDGFAEDVLESLARNKLEGSSVVLEITEGVALKNIDLAKKVMLRLCDRGVTFALDDFGCGYSNLSSLTRLPISVLKMDRSLLMNIETDEPAQVIIRNVVALCRDLGVQSISEGVERVSQLEFLRHIGCDAVQGFLCGKPSPPAAIGTVLSEFHRPA